MAARALPGLRHRPAELKALCLLFLLWSGLSFVANIPRWSAERYVLDLGAFGFLAALGLWRFSPAGRKFALLLTWYWLIGSVLLLLELFPLGGVRITSNSDFLAWVPPNVLRTVIVPFLLAQLWQLRTLKRPDIQALFSAPPPVAALGTHRLPE